MREPGRAERRKRVLFLYNVPEWAIHNVGRYWASLISDTHDVTLMQFGHHENEDPAAYDHVVWGYSTLRHSGRMLLASLRARPLGWLRWRRHDTYRPCAVIQDPCELFPEVPDWKKRRSRRSHLGKFRRLAVTSNEMRDVMTELGYDVVKVNTRSLLPLRDPASLETEGLRVLTRTREYPRKNLALFHALRRRFHGVIEHCDAVVGDAVMPQGDYVDLLDRHNCYVCTSWQEGGPLPLMDALQRGCAVLTTRVGQTDELIEEGGNGFFCAGEEEFAARILQLHESPRLLRDMRLRALSLAGARQDDRIRDQLLAFLP
jgi:hypothetical protein